MPNRFVELTINQLRGNRWLLAGSVVEVDADIAKRLFERGHAKDTVKTTEQIVQPPEPKPAKKPAKKKKPAAATPATEAE